MTIKETAKKAAAKVDKVVSGFDDEKERKYALGAKVETAHRRADKLVLVDRNPGEMEVDPHMKATNNELSTIDHSRVRLIRLHVSLQRYLLTFLSPHTGCQPRADPCARISESAIRTQAVSRASSSGPYVITARARLLGLVNVSSVAGNLSRL